MYSAREENEGFSQDPMVPPSDHGASASPKGIVYNHEDWGKPINYYNNLKNNFQVPNVQISPTQPFAASIQEKINATCQAYKLCTQEQQMVEFMVFRSLSQVDLKNYKSDQQDWILNNIILEIVTKIRNMDFHMEQFINNELQQMKSMLNAYDPNQKQSHWVPYIY